MEFAERFGAAVDVSTPAGDVGYFLVRPRGRVDLAAFRATVAAAVGGNEYVPLESAGGFVVVVTRYGTAQVLRTHPLVEHVGGVEVDPEQFPTPEVVVNDKTRDSARM